MVPGAPSGRLHPAAKAGSHLKQWLLIVFDGSGHQSLMRSLGLSPSKSKAGQFIGFYSLEATAVLRRQIARLKEVGLHGIAKKVEARKERPARQPRQHRPQPTPATFRSPATIHRISDAREKLERAQQKQLERELAKQAEQQKQRDLDDHARDVLRRAQGE